MRFLCPEPPALDKTEAVWWRIHSLGENFQTYDASRCRHKGRNVSEYSIGDPCPEDAFPFAVQSSELHNGKHMLSSCVDEIGESKMLFRSISETRKRIALRRS